MADNPQVEVEIINDVGAPLPTSDSDVQTKVGALTETAPASDTASSGLNGRLQRIAQRLTSIFTAQSDGTQQTKIKGGSDGTIIGNVGEALQVTTVNPVPTFSASIKDLMLANSCTDFFAITGSASKKIKILQILFSATKNNTGFVDLRVVKRSTANSGGTSSAPTKVPHDSDDPAATGTVLAYTANPTLGTLVGDVLADKVFVPSATANSSRGSSTLSISPIANGKAITLRGITEVLALNLGGDTAAGIDCDITITWTEE